MTLLVKNDINEDISSQYTGGECHIFALALHKKINKPIIGIMISSPPDKDGFIEELFLHAAVLIDKDIYADINGIHKFTPESQNHIHSYIKLKDDEKFDYKTFDINNEVELDNFLSKFPDEDDLTISYEEAIKEASYLIDSSNYLSTLNKYNKLNNKSKKRLKR